jgi:hypothetical protein
MMLAHTLPKFKIGFVFRATEETTVSSGIDICKYVAPLTIMTNLGSGENLQEYHRKSREIDMQKK